MAGVLCPVGGLPLDSDRSGEVQGIMGIQWHFEATPEGVHVATSESFSGVPVDAAPDALKSTLDNSLTTWLNRLKTKAEPTDQK